MQIERVTNTRVQPNHTNTPNISTGISDREVQHKRMEGFTFQKRNPVLGLVQFLFIHLSVWNEGMREGVKGKTLQNEKEINKRKKMNVKEINKLYKK